MTEAREGVAVEHTPAGAPPAIDSDSVLNALPDPVMVIGDGNAIRYVNYAGEQLFRVSAGVLTGLCLEDIIPHDSPVLLLVERARRGGRSMTQHDVHLESPRIGEHRVSVEAAPLGEQPANVVLTVKHNSIASKIDQSLTHRDSVRSITAMAAMLAHEIKNPLSGVRGAAQLLEQTVGEEDVQLTRLIVEETDRICALIDRMEAFTGESPIEDRGPVNIHEVLERVITLGKAGFASGLRFSERYDPSLPPVFGNRDRLIQAFLNLVKNAAEAVPAEDGEIVIATAFQHGVRLAAPGGETPMHLPLMVSIQDNGPGIPDDLRRQIFDPFVTTKRGGTGLGLPLVAKLIGDHGGVIDVESRPRRTVFRVFLPVVMEQETG